MNVESFWNKVDKINGPIHPYDPEMKQCWLWTGYKTSKGYGRRSTKISDERFTHRISWILNNDPIPESIKVLHTCDNPSCVNPSHLFLGTIEDNTQDMVNKNRQAKGIELPQHKLTEDQVRFIKQDTTHFQQELADMFGTKQSNISYIKNGKGWKYVI